MTDSVDALATCSGDSPDHYYHVCLGVTDMTDVLPPWVSQCSVGCHVLPHSLPVFYTVICHGLGGASRALWTCEGHLEFRTGHSGVGPCGFGNPTATSTRVLQYPQTALSGVSAALPVLHLPADFTMGPSSPSPQAWNFLEDFVCPLFPPRGLFPGTALGLAASP